MRDRQKERFIRLLRRGAEIPPGAGSGDVPAHQAQERITSVIEKEDGRTIKAAVVLSVLTITAGCAVSRDVYTPSGEKGHSINCSGTAMTWGNCYEKAGELCGASGYEVIAGGAEQGHVVSGSQYGFFGGTTMSRSMVIKCRTSGNEGKA